MNQTRTRLSYLLTIYCCTAISTSSATEIIAHRGASHDAPENTLSSFRLGWEQGTDTNELDIHLTKDGQIIVLHDANTKRTTGVDKPVVEQTLAEIRAQDAGKWKDEKFAGERIPTLAEALETMPGGKRTFIEIKCGSEVLPELERVLSASGKQPAQLVIIGFNYDTMSKAKQRFPQLQAYWIVDAKPPRGKDKLPSLAELSSKAKAAHLNGLDLSWKFPLDAAAISEIKQQGLQIYVWTVDDETVARRLAKAGVDGITTNRPQWLRQRLAATAEATKATGQ